MKILVTGVGGNVGQYVAKELYNKGYDVIGCYHLRRPENVSFPIISCDLSKEIPIETRFDTVIHIAAKITGTAEQLIENNVHAMKNLLIHCSRLGVKKFIYTSTVSVYGSVQDELTLDTDIINPDTYGISKYLGEKLLEESEIRDKIILELPRMLGPFVDLTDTSGSGFLTMARKVLNGEDVTCYIPMQIYNNFLHVCDLTCFIEKLLNQQFEGDRHCLKLLLGNQDKITMMEILEIMKNSIHSASNLIAEDRGCPAKCSIVSIKEAEKYGFSSMSAEDTITRFMKEVERRMWYN